MPITIPLEPGETVYLDSQEFALGVTDRAIFIPKQVAWTTSDDPWYMQRVPHSEVREVAVKRVPSPFWITLAAALWISGGVAAYSALRHDALSPFVPVGLLLVGILVSPLTRGKFGLVITMERETFKWAPPIVIDRSSRNEIEEIFSSTKSACRRVGLHFVDERHDARPPG